MKTKNLSISKSIVVVPLLLITILTLSGFGLIDLYFYKTTLDRVKKDITRLAVSGSQTLDFLDINAGHKDFDHYADTFAENSRFRITIIDFAGTVLGDSMLSPEEVLQFENLSDRPEIMEAKESGIGISRRFSSTMNIDLLYVALRHNSLGRKLYFRIAWPLTDLNQDLMRQHLILGGFCIIALLIAATLSLLASRYLLSLVKKNEEDLEHLVIKKEEEIQILQNLGTQLTACNSINEALSVIKVVTAILLPQYTGTLSLYRSSKDRLEIVKSWNGDWKGEESYSPDQCWALRTGRPHLGDQATGNMTCSHTPNPEEKLLCIPVVAQGETYGVLHFKSPKDLQWLRVERQLANAVAEQASLTLANLKLRENLRQQAVLDPLTGLYNRRYLLKAIENEIKRASRHNQNLGLLMIDLDHFKKFNDENGHDIGDFILTEFSRLVKTIIRNEDVPCRYGGEEFTILIPETDHDGTLRLAEKIRKKVKKHDFNSNNRSYGPITLSIGAAIFPFNGNSSELLLKKADEALYLAKEAGRDRVVMNEKTLDESP